MNKIEEFLLIIKNANEYIRLNKMVIAEAYEAIEAMSEFKVGDIVEIDTIEKTSKAFVGHVGVNDDGTIYYQFYKIKKDGKMSAHRHIIDNIVSIKKIEA